MSRVVRNGRVIGYNHTKGNGHLKTETNQSSIFLSLRLTQPLIKHVAGADLTIAISTFFVKE
jgi:hypothetical protein